MTPFSCGRQIQCKSKLITWQGYQCLTCSCTAGGRLNLKMSSYQYRDSHVKGKTVSPTVLSLTWESPYLGKTVFILRWGPGFFFPSLFGKLTKDKYSALYQSLPNKLCQQLILDPQASQKLIGICYKGFTFAWDNFLFMYIWVRSRNCGCLVTWFCYQLIAKPGNKTAAVSWPDPYL